MASTVRAAGLILYRRCGLPDKIEFLLLKASYGDHHWSVPKGHVDPGEDDLTTAIRETEEESGIKANELKIDTSNTIDLDYFVGNKLKFVKYFIAELIGQQADVKLSDEHEDFVWLNLAEACEKVQFPGMQSALKKAYLHSVS